MFYRWIRKEAARVRASSQVFRSGTGGNRPARRTDI